MTNDRHRFAQDNAEVDLEELRRRLRRMSDQELKRFGEASRFMCSKRANGNSPPRKPFLVQLAEARAGWWRRKIKEKKAGEIGIGVSSSSCARALYRPHR